MKKKVAGSNWNKLKPKVTVAPQKKTIEKTGEPVSAKKRKSELKELNLLKVSEQRKGKKGSFRRKTDEYVGLDCEMVGIGADGKKSALARACLVDYHGKVIYDQFVRPRGFVTDFRTQWSGVRKKDLRQGEAIPFEEVGKVLFLFHQPESPFLSFPPSLCPSPSLLLFLSKHSVK